MPALTDDPLHVLSILSNDFLGDFEPGVTVHQEIEPSSEFLLHVEVLLHNSVHELLLLPEHSAGVVRDESYR